MYTLASEFCLFFSDMIIDSLYFSYGRKDTVIIHSMLLWMLGAANLPNDTLSLLGLLHFIEAFLAHFITAYLIMQDLGCNIKLRHQITLASGTVGDVLHPYEADQKDDEIDMILESINNMGQNNEVISDQGIPSMHEQHDGIWPATPAPGLSKLALSTGDSVLSKKTKTTRRTTRWSCWGAWACILVLLCSRCLPSFMFPPAYYYHHYHLNCTFFATELHKVFRMITRLIITNYALQQAPLIDHFDADN